MSNRPFSTSAYRDAARALAATSQRLYANGWSPATSSNYSMRLDDSSCAITVSGKDKGHLTEADIMVVNLQGEPLTDGKPSAETGLHTQLYRRFDSVGAVLHTHSIASTVLTMHGKPTTITLEGYELLKALDGISTHEVRLDLPIFENDQDIDALSERVDQMTAQPGIAPAYLIRGHGLYTWASTLDACYRQIEALEYLFQIELHRRQIGGHQ